MFAILKSETFRFDRNGLSSEEIVQPSTISHAIYSYLYIFASVLSFKPDETLFKHRYHHSTSLYKGSVL